MTFTVFSYRQLKDRYFGALILGLLYKSLENCNEQYLVLIKLKPIISCLSQMV